ISKLDSDGNFVWAKNLGGASADSGEGIAVQNDGSLYLIGTFSDTVDFNLGTGTSTLTSAGSLDVFIARLDLTPQIHYVKWDATGTNDGSSWEDAYIDLQSALAAASSGDEIWVAAGTYKPTAGTDRTISFVLKNGVAVYGGFAGTETANTQRNYVTNVTVLNADIGVENDNSDNSYHVVVGSNTDNSAILDGFTVRGGNADHDSYLSEQSKGGGMYNETGSPTLSNMIFKDNFATSGGGIANRQSSPTLSNVTFTNNIAASLGGGMHNESSSSPVLTSVTLDGNSAPNGGGMHNLESTPKLTGVIFLNNGGTSYGAGGGMTNNHSAPILVSVTFSENSAGEGGGMYNYYGNPTLTNVTFSGNIADSGGGMRNELSNPILTDVMFSANVASSGSGMQNSHSNPVLTNVT
ncbi:MAG TPA: cadherin, partial [Patescibacteria group bacterium]|nr:cadherin [Patescibacteria group bacterium]